jgi:hypothetical protein
MSAQSPAVTLREVSGDLEELAAPQRIMERDEGFALRVTGHPPGPADAQSTLMFVPEGKSPDDKVAFGGVGRRRAGRHPPPRRLPGPGGRGPVRWLWVQRLRLSVVRTNDQVLGFWHRMG